MPIVGHLDLDAFFAAVEELLEPVLAGRPLVIGADPQGGYGRGVVSTANYAARAFGIRSAMPIAEAFRRCPTATFRPARIATYRPYSQRVLAMLGEAAVAVEPVSIDEAFFDCGLDFAATVAVARTLQARIRAEIGLSASLGIGSGKLVAKIASDLRKPGGLVTVPPGEEAAFLAPLPVGRMWGVGPVTVARLREVGVTTIGDLAALAEAQLTAIAGRRGPELGALARGQDDRPLVMVRDPKQLTQEHTFERDTRDVALLDATLVAIVEQVARRMARRGVWARTAVLKLRYSDFTTLTRHLSPGYAIADAPALLDLARHLLATTREPGRAVRLIGAGVQGLAPVGAAYQLPLLAWAGSPTAPP
ncbi:MAG: DNA polymerase IV [Chloroflexi bacterium]|nr:DNA polymerase IV [Chloroflexota bacterium]